MGVDISQFHQVFFEESFEGLDAMESALLGLDAGTADTEIINTIFRAAHSIKGGAGTFGFSVVANFTHVVETLLDEVRDGKRQVTQEMVTLLLTSVDVMRAMLESTRDGTELDAANAADVQKQLEVMLSGEASSADEAAAGADSSEAPAASANEGWKVSFEPQTHLLQTGNDPVRIFRELGDLGGLDVACDASKLPSFTDLDPESSYLKWTLELHGDIAEDQVREVFEWVEDDCALDITPLTSGAPATGATDEAPQEDGLAVDILESSFALLAPQAEELVKRFYDELFKRFPQVKPLFEGTSQAEQEKKLLAALKLVINSLRKPEALTKALTELGKKHQGYGAVAEHYQAVGDTLLDVMAELAGEHWTDEIANAWRSALKAISELMLEAYAEDSTAPASQAAPAAAAAPAAKPAGRSAGEGGSIRVDIDKVDAIINLVGELVITQSMLGQMGADLEDVEQLDVDRFQKLSEGLAQLERNTRELQESVMQIRMLPISFAFNRFPRLVRDLTQKMGKKINLNITGEGTELDKTLMEKIGDPLVHLVRNALDHGIEMPDARVAAGKPETGTVDLEAYHKGGNIVIEIRDDGAGINRDRLMAKARERGLVGEHQQLPDNEILELIFHPGFSTAEVVSDISGRGVGMDVVRKNIKSLGGSVEIQSELGKGTTFLVRLPLTLSILDGQLVRVGEETYIVPLVSIVESLQIRAAQVNAISGRAEMYKLRDEYIPIIRLHDAFGMPAENRELDGGLMVVVEGDGRRAGLVVDDLLAQQQVVIKSLETNYQKVEGLSGATILGDGTVALILDTAGLVSLARSGASPSTAAA